MNQVAKALERLRPWLPLRESASFSGAFDAVYSGAHADVVTLWQDALFREQKFEEQKQDLDEEWGAQAKDSQRRFFDPLQEKARELEAEKAQLEAERNALDDHLTKMDVELSEALAREERLQRERDTYAAMVRDRDDWRDKAYSASEGMRKAVARAEAAEARAEQAERERDDLKVEVSNLWASAGRKSAQVDKLLREQKKTSEFVPHFKLHRDGSVTPEQDDTPAWSTGPSPFALTVPESMVEEVEVTTEAASWRAGGTGVPISWNLDKLREMRDGALQEWIEVEAIIREVEKREKEEDPVEALADELWEAGRNNDDPPWHLARQGARARTIRQARHVLRKRSR